MAIPSKVVESFNSRFGTYPEFAARSPGRVNLIGEHTDYNDGFVLPIAIDRDLWIGVRSRPDRKIQVVSDTSNQRHEFDLDSIIKGSGWIEYIKGVAAHLQLAGIQFSGWDGIISSDIPIGAGLSSSAALELAAARVMIQLSGISWEPTKMAELCQQAEQSWVGVHCGIMDQMVVARSKKGHAFFLDCRTLEGLDVSLPNIFTIFVLDTQTRRDLVSSAYNERRDQCEEAARLLGVTALRDISVLELSSQANKLNITLLKRARHVITENERVNRVIDACKSGNIGLIGKLINESHESLRNDFEVSSEAMDAIVNAARKQNGCLGARLTGAGFGGCAIAVVESAYIEGFEETTASLYKQATGLDARIYRCRASDGTNIWSM
jgi:galactokinase